MFYPDAVTLSHRGTRGARQTLEVRTRLSVTTNSSQTAAPARVCRYGKCKLMACVQSALLPPLTIQSSVLFPVSSSPLTRKMQSLTDTMFVFRVLGGSL